jgi:hypothetical protein
MSEKRFQALVETVACTEGEKADLFPQANQPQAAWDSKLRLHDRRSTDQRTSDPDPATCQ